MAHRHLQYHVKSGARGLSARHHHVLEHVRPIAVEPHVPTPVLQARADSTSSSESSSSPSCTSAAQCEKPVSDSSFTIPVALGVIIPVVAAAILFFFLHRRHNRKLREEDANDRHASMDFGMGEVAKNGEKKPDRHHQLSMDMNLTSPYLLPPELHASRESLHSLSRTVHENEDPYRPVSRGGHGDAMSMRSARKGDGASVYTASSNVGSKLHQEVMPTDFLANNPAPRSTSPYMPLPRQNSLGQKGEGNASPDSSSPQNPFASPEDTLPFNPLPSEKVPYPTEPPQAHIPTPANDIARKAETPGPKPSLPAPQTAEILDVDAMSDAGNPHRKSGNFLGQFAHEEQSHPANQHADNSGGAVPDILRPARTSALPPINTHESTVMDEESEYGEGFKITPPSPGHKAEQIRAQRYSMDVPPEEFANAGLGAPGFDAKRLSMGFRPLPPEAATDHDDPEVRANRIRSFYKEYFDDSKPAPAGQYYEDYDETYLGENPDFVMPFAQPVARRAMTPPPRAPRFQGPPPRARHGSMSGPRGPPPPRGMFPPNSRAASAMSGSSEGPRPYSSASNRVGPAQPKKQLPPPADLTTLPTPSKLKDDSFALMGTIDFAPPTSMKDRVAGRSESPFGERRPYSPAVPAFKPLVSAFDDLAPMPSPALLRKSGTFTSLDFAPPRKFRDPDAMSDAGSIRSNKSGISAGKLGAIRNGAYRISRLPTDQVGTRDDLSASLKPQWGMRN